MAFVAVRQIYPRRGRAARPCARRVVCVCLRSGPCSPLAWPRDCRCHQFRRDRASSAQGFTYNPQPPRPKPPRVANDNQMLVQAVEVDYDYNNSRVSAVGNVQMFYNGTSSKPTR